MMPDEFYLREAVAYVTTPGSTTRPPTLMGWTDGPASTLPPEVRRDIVSGIPIPETAQGVRSELQVWQAQLTPAVWVRARMALLIERLDALEQVADSHPAKGPEPHAPARSGHLDVAICGQPRRPELRAPARTGHKFRAPETADRPGHPARTQKQAREAVRALLGTGISNREIARRVGVSPSTVGAVQKAMT
jgi:hypothetical protein